MPLAIALQVLTSLLANAAPILQVLTTANAEGRTTLTEAEWAQVKASADSAHQALLEALGTPPAPPAASGPKA